MEEKYMVNDILQEIKSMLLMYQEYILEAQNMQFRQILQKIRDIEESFQYEILKIAEVKGYYKPSKEANANQIEQIKNELEK